MLIFHSSHGYSLPTKNGASAKAVLMHTKTPDGIERFRWEIWIADILQEVPQKIIIVIGSGMSDACDAMSSDSRARADHAYDLFRESSHNPLIFPTARFTYRFLRHANPELNPLSTDAREIAKYMVSRGVQPERIICSEWSNCTVGDAVFARLVLGWIITPNSTMIQIVSSGFAEERAKIAFGLLFPEWDIQYSMTRWGLSPENEEKRRAVEVKVNEMYRQQIDHYWLKNGHPLEQWLKFLREICTSTPWNVADEFNRALNDETGWSQATTDTYKS